jgi:hypothetical protein
MTETRIPENEPSLTEFLLGELTNAEKWALLDILRTRRALGSNQYRVWLDVPESNRAISFPHQFTVTLACTLMREGRP